MNHLFITIPLFIVAVLLTVAVASDFHNDGMRRVRNDKRR